MRSLLYFLLGFTIVASSLICSASNLPYPGQCSRVFYQSLGTTSSVSRTTWTVTSTGALQLGAQHYAPTPVYAVGVVFKRNDNCGTNCACWGHSAAAGSLGADYPGEGTPVSVNPTQLANLCNAGLLTCQTECPDSDSDGTCDACDAAPDDSTEGPDTYLHGYYTYGGKVVAVQHGGSSNKDNGYYTTVLDRTVPGAVIGGSGGIDEETFIGAGGQYRALQEGQKVMTTSCPPVTDTSECTSGGLDCIHDYPDAGKDEALGDFEEVQPDMPDGETMPPGPDDLAQDDPFLDTPDRDCPTYSTLCANSCGGSPGVRRFACTEFDGGKKNVACECTNDGGYWTSPDYGTGFDDSSEGEDGNPDADDVESGGKATGSTTINGDTGTGGGSVDSDQDGDIDGYQQGERVINYGPLLNATSNIAGRFPFSIISTLKNMGDSFTAQGQCPSFSLPVWNQTVNFDLCAFNGIASLIRNLFSFVLTAACFWGLIKFFM